MNIIILGSNCHRNQGTSAYGLNRSASCSTEFGMAVSEFIAQLVSSMIVEGIRSMNMSHSWDSWWLQFWWTFSPLSHFGVRFYFVLLVNLPSSYSLNTNWNQNASIGTINTDVVISFVSLWAVLHKEVKYHLYPLIPRIIFPHETIHAKRMCLNT